MVIGDGSAIPSLILIPIAQRDNRLGKSKKAEANVSSFPLKLGEYPNGFAK